jgi:hypothetical protein
LLFLTNKDGKIFHAVAHTICSVCQMENFQLYKLNHVALNKESNIFVRINTLDKLAFTETDCILLNSELKVQECDATEEL